jgi:hypothetical protein
MRCPALKRALSSFEGRSAEHLEPLAAVCSLILSLRACWASAEGMGWLGDRTMKLWLCVPRVCRLDDIELAITAMPVETNRFIAEIQLPPRDAFVRDVAGGSGAILRPRRPA